jgi:hypothetical protein
MSTAVWELRSPRWLSAHSSPDQAATLRERTVAVRIALAQGVPLHEIEADLDWLDAVEARSQFVRR